MTKAASLLKYFQDPFRILSRVRLRRGFIFFIPGFWWFFPLLPDESRENSAILYPFSMTGSVALIQSLLYGLFPLSALHCFKSCSQVTGFFPVMWLLTISSCFLLIFSRDRKKAIVLFSTIFALVFGSAFSWFLAHFWLCTQTLIVFHHDFAKKSTST